MSKLSDFAHRRRVSRIVNAVYEWNGYSQVTVDTALRAKWLARYAVHHSPWISRWNWEVAQVERLGRWQWRWILR